MAYATADDVAAVAAKQFSDEEQALVERRLAQVERMILRRVPDLADQITAGSIALVDVVDIEAEAVYRVIRNPEGVRYESDGNYSYQLSTEAADNSLRITAEEWRILGVKVGSMFAIAPRLGGVV